MLQKTEGCGYNLVVKHVHSHVPTPNPLGSTLSALKRLKRARVA